MGKLTFVTITLKRDSICNYCMTKLEAGHIAYIRMGGRKDQTTFCNIDCHNKWEDTNNILYSTYSEPMVLPAEDDEILEEDEPVFDTRPSAENSIGIMEEINEIEIQ